LGGADIGRLEARGQPGKYFTRPHLQNNQHKIDWRCILCLLCKHKAPSSNPSPIKKKFKGKMNIIERKKDINERRCNFQSWKKKFWPGLILDWIGSKLRLHCENG
jgi:hypothetical protein